MADKPDVFTAKVLSFGRITIPEEIRKLWDITDDDYVVFKVVSVHKQAEITKEA